MKRNRPNKKRMQKELHKLNAASKLPESGQIVMAKTKYGKTVECIYNHLKFTPVNKSYTFSQNQIVEWTKENKDVENIDNK